MRAPLLAALLCLAAAAPARPAEAAFKTISAPRAFAGPLAAWSFTRVTTGSPQVSLGPLWQAARSLFTEEGALQLASQAANESTLLPRERMDLQRRLAQAQAAAGAIAMAELNKAAKAALDSEVPAELVARFQKDAAGYAIYGRAVESRWRAVGKLLAMRQDAKVAALLKDPFDRKDEGVKPVSDTRLTSGLERPSLNQVSSDFTRPDTGLTPPAPSKPNLAKRAGTALVLVPGVVLLAHWGGLAFVGFTTALSGLMAFEFGGLMAHGGRPLDRGLVTLAAAGIALATAFGQGGAALAAGVTLLALRETLRREHDIARLAFGVLGLALFGFLPAHLALLRALPVWGEKLTLLVVASTMAVDTAAMFAGKTFGKRKLAPYLSPNKTWAGAVGGFLAAFASALLFTHFWPGLFGWRGALAFAAVIGGLGQISGLLSSMIKRANGAKDSGTLLPGHGGFLDRFDAYLLAAAAAYALARLLL